MNANENYLAVCPYYKFYNSKRTIQCECTIRQARQLTVFRSNKQALRHVRRFCDTYEWDSCPYAEMLNAKYDAEESEGEF